MHQEEGYWYTLRINPEPWVVPPFSVGRRNGKVFPVAGRDQSLHSYQEAVRDELRLIEPVVLEPPYYLRFWFWRQVPKTKSQRGNVADATNLQKALEDALQGVMIDNDQQVARVQSEIVEQGEDVNPCIVIFAFSKIEPTDLSHFPPSVQRDITKPYTAAEPNYNEWRGPGT